MNKKSGSNVKPLQFLFRSALGEVERTLRAAGEAAPAFQAAF